MCAAIVFPTEIQGNVEGKERQSLASANPKTKQRVCSVSMTDTFEPKPKSLPRRNPVVTAGLKWRTKQEWKRKQHFLPSQSFTPYSKGKVELKRLGKEGRKKRRESMKVYKCGVFIP